MQPLLRTSLKTLAACADVARRRAPGFTILIYHRVGSSSGLEIDLETGVFRDQIAELAATAKVVALDQALGLVGSGRSDEEDHIVVTFDDGTADFAEHAFPVLAEHGVPVTLYLATDFVEEGQPFPVEGRPLSWRQLADCVSTGLLTVGSHTHRHLLLDRLPVAEAEVELDRSVGLIEERLGVPAEHFAYPKAVAPSAENEEVVRRRFRSAALAGTRSNPYRATDVHRLRRSPVQVSDGMRWFRRKVAGGMSLEDDLRSLVNRRRYASTTS